MYYFEIFHVELLLAQGINKLKIRNQIPFCYAVKLLICDLYVFNIQMRETRKHSELLFQIYSYLYSA